VKNIESIDPICAIALKHENAVLKIYIGNLCDAIRRLAPLADAGRKALNGFLCSDLADAKESYFGKLHSLLLDANDAIERAEDVVRDAIGEDAE